MNLKMLIRNRARVQDGKTKTLKRLTENGVEVWEDAVFGRVVYSIWFDKYYLYTYTNAQRYVQTDEWYVFDKYLIDKKTFDTERECWDYCIANDIEVVNVVFVHDSMGHGWGRKEAAFRLFNYKK